MSTTFQVQVGRGVITFPKELRDQNNIAGGEILNLIELSNDVYVISRRRSKVDEIANKLAQEWQESGKSLAYLLASGMIESIAESPDAFIERAKIIVASEPDAYVLAEALAAELDWFITHDKARKSRFQPGIPYRSTRGLDSVTGR